MAASQGVTGFGTLLGIGNSSGGLSTVFTTVAECRDISGPSLSTELVDFTHQTSPGNYRERKPTFLSAGEISMDLNFLPEDATQGYSAGLLDSFEGRELVDFQLKWPNSAATHIRFQAYITAFQIAAPIGDRLSARATLSITGAVNWGNSTST